MDERLELTADGEILEGWASVSVSRAFDKLAGGFRVDLVDTHPNAPLDRPLKRGGRVEIRVDGNLVLSGRIQRYAKSYDGDANEVSVSGRDVVADLIDASAVNEPGEWNGARIETIASDIVAPFEGIRFRSDLSPTGLGSVEKFALQTSETAFRALDRLARMRGLLLASDLAGGVYFTQPGTTRAPIALERGVNIERGQVVEDDSDRHDRYIVSGEAPSPSWWDAGGSPGQAIRAEATDAGIDRWRPLVIQAETAGSEGDMLSRASLEASTRAARSTSISYTFGTWILDGYLWNPGDLVPVYDPILEIGTQGGAPVDMMISAVELSRAKGSRAVVELAPPAAFSTRPVPKPDNAGAELWLN